MKKTMVHLHNHNHKGSFLDSILTIEQLVKFTKDNGLPSVALTDHGSMDGFVDLVKACKAENIKPIIGCEIYEVENYEEKRNKRYHLVLLAKNKTGFENLSKIVTKSNENFYYKPIITIDDIQQNNWGEGIICLTACMAGRLHRGLAQNLDMLDYMQTLEKTFDNVFCEIQSHKNEQQKTMNLLIEKFAEENGFEMVVTTDAHMSNKEDLFAHSVFVRIGQDRDVGEIYNGCYLQNGDETYDYLKNTIKASTYKKAIENTYLISDMVEEYEVGLNNKNQMPKIICPENFKSNLDFFKHLVFDNLNKKWKKYKFDKEKYIERVNLEIDIFKKLGYIDYFLVLEPVLNRCHKAKIPLGPLRGSSGGSLCNWLLGITKLDSIKWDLDFSRFANLGRTELADIDIDVSQNRRSEIIQISKDLYGDDCVAPMKTYTTFSTKNAIRDIGKVLNDSDIEGYSGLINAKFRKYVGDMIPTISTFKDLSDSNESKEDAFKKFCQSNDSFKKVYKEFPLWFELVLKLEGLIRGYGTHASGVLISPKPLTNYAPMTLSKDNMIFSLDMHNAMDDLKLIKMDYLGLRTLDVLDDTMKFLGSCWEDFDLESLDINDKAVLHNVFEKGNTNGVFQCESLEAKKMLRDLDVNSIEDIIALVAFNRPGTKGNFPIYLKNQRLPLKNKDILHPDLIPIFQKTEGVLLYQEQALKIFEFAGFPEDERDNARRNIGKKKLEKMKELKIKFVDLMHQKPNWTDDKIEEVWKLMELQASYSLYDTFCNEKLQHI